MPLHVLIMGFYRVLWGRNRVGSQSLPFTYMLPIIKQAHKSRALNPSGPMRAPDFHVLRWFFFLWFWKQHMVNPKIRIPPPTRRRFRLNENNQKFVLFQDFNICSICACA